MSVCVSWREFQQQSHGEIVIPGGDRKDNYKGLLDTERGVEEQRERERERARVNLCLLGFDAQELLCLFGFVLCFHINFIVNCYRHKNKCMPQHGRNGIHQLPSLKTALVVPHTHNQPNALMDGCGQICSRNLNQNQIEFPQTALRHLEYEERVVLEQTQVQEVVQSACS